MIYQVLFPASKSRIHYLMSAQCIIFEPSAQICVITIVHSYDNTFKSPLKMMKNAFYSTFKSSFRSQDNQIFVFTLWS